MNLEFGAGPLKERGWGNEEDKVHLHLLVVAPERPAVDKLFAKDFGPFVTTPAAFQLEQFGGSSQDVTRKKFD